MSGQNGYRCPYCGDRFETQARLDAHVPCPDPSGDVKPDRPKRVTRDTGNNR